MKNPKELLLADHARLDKLFAELLAMFKSEDNDAIDRAWTAFDEGLTSHLDAEEKHILPLFRQVDAKEADAILAEHAGFREKLASLGVMVDLHAVDTKIAAEFVAGLRAHAHREDRLMYTWADEHLGKPERESLLASVQQERTR